MNEWSVKKATMILVGSTCLILALSFGSYAYYKHVKETRLKSDAYLISSIIQTGPEKEALKTTYLAELMGLSADKPAHLYALDIAQLESKLKASPLIRSAKVKRLPPSSLYVDYELRKPIALLADFKNMAVDRDGVVFPVAPFFSPKHLPEIYLGLQTLSTHLSGPYFDLALEILKTLESAPWKEGLRIVRIDVCNAFAPSLGTREVVLITEEEVSFRNHGSELVWNFPKILRLAPKDYSHQLKCFFSLRKTMMDQYVKQLSALKEGGRFAPRIIDLRIPQLAFVEKGN